LRVEHPGVYERWARDGKVIDTVPEPTHPSDPPAVLLGTPVAWSLARQVPFTPIFTWTLSPHGYFVTGFADDRDGSYSVELRLPIRHPGDAGARPAYWKEGDPVRSIRVPYTPVPIAQEERDAWQSTYTAYFRDRNPLWTWNSVDIPGRRPPYKMLWADGDGRIWISLHTAPEVDTSYNERRRGGEVNTSYPLLRWQEGQAFDILEPSGLLLGRVLAPERIYPAAARGDTLWAYIDEGVNQRVKRYRVVWGG
jgi:hypothetical protein